MKFPSLFKASKSTRMLYGSDFHGADAVYRKFISAGLQYQVSALIVGGDVTGKAMVPVIHQGGGRYVGHLFGRQEAANNPDELVRVKKNISGVGFYPIVIEKDEAQALENDPELLAQRFEHEMCQRVRDWMQLAEEKLKPQNITLYFMAGNDDLLSIDEVIKEFPAVHDPNLARFETEDGFEIVGLSYANMTPWRCVRDLEEPELESKLAELEKLVVNPETTIAVLHVPPYDSALDTCPELDKNLKITTQGGQVVMKAAGSPAVRRWIEKVQPMLSLHGHIHESPGHTHLGRTLSINAGSEYAEGILKAALINLENKKIKGHMMISG